ncbi:MAG: TetR/AcrR family transcriptional regulator [Clostridia bacterium]|nr:TetR/AcrR family transcriptional regulator [Clostridia bacterium]
MPKSISDERLKNIAKKVYASYARCGLDGVSVDELSAETGISKATLYHYFKSKEDIVRGMVATMTERLDSAVFGDAESFDGVLNDVKDFYYKSVIFAAMSGTKFMSDLKRKLPDAYESCMSSRISMRERFSSFHESGRKKGYFKDLYCPFVIRQFDCMVSGIVGAEYGQTCDMDLCGALKEYFKMFLSQILTEKYLMAADREATYEFCGELAAVLTGDFFVGGAGKE